MCLRDSRSRICSPAPAATFCRFLVTAHFTNYELVHLVINATVLAVLLLAKLPEMHGVRLLGFNRAHDAEE
jgi:hypothetical protein